MPVFGPFSSSGTAFYTLNRVRVTEVRKEALQPSVCWCLYIRLLSHNFRKPSLFGTVCTLTETD